MKVYAGVITHRIESNFSIGQAGSAQQLGITKVKTDLLDRTISVSVLVLRSFNADFDGDMLFVIYMSYITYV